MLSRLKFHLEEQEKDLVTIEAEAILHKEEEEKIHSLRVEGLHQVHRPISHQQEEGGATIIKEKCMKNIISNVIIVINLGILHLSVEKDNMT